MKNSIQTHLSKYRVQIRKTKLQQFLNQKRKMFDSLPKQQATQMLIPILQTIKKQVFHSYILEQTLPSLQSLSLIATKHSVLRFLMERVHLNGVNISMLKVSEQNEQLTYFDLLMELIIKFYDQAEIIQLISGVIQNCSFQLKVALISIYSSPTERKYQSCYKKLLRWFPYQLINYDRLLVVQDSVNLVYNMILGGKDGTTVYYLLNRIKPNILTLFNVLLTTPVTSQVEPLRSTVVSCVLTLVFYIQRYNYIKHQEQQYLLILLQLKKMIYNTMMECAEKQTFLKYCQFLDIFMQTNTLELKRQEFEQIQGMMEREFAFGHVEYIKLLQKIMYHHTYTFSEKSIELIFRKLFEMQGQKMQGQSLEAEMRYKSDLVVLFNDHLVNCGNQFRQQDASVFLSNWGQFSKADRLIRLFSLFDGYCSEEKYLSILCQLVCKLFQSEYFSHLQSSLDLTQQQVQVLLTYEIFTEALRQHQIELL